MGQGAITGIPPPAWNGYQLVYWGQAVRGLPWEGGTGGGDPCQRRCRYHDEQSSGHSDVPCQGRANQAQILGSHAFPRELASSPRLTEPCAGPCRGMRTVRVRKGETLYMLAQQHKVSLLELQRLNRIDDVRASSSPPPPPPARRRDRILTLPHPHVRSGAGEPGVRRQGARAAHRLGRRDHQQACPTVACTSGHVCGGHG